MIQYLEILAVEILQAIIDHRFHDAKYLKAQQEAIRNWVYMNNPYCVGEAYNESSE